MTNIEKELQSLADIEDVIVCEECGNRLRGIYFVLKKANTDLNKILCSFCLYENHLKRK